MKCKGKLLICLLAVLLGTLEARAQYDKDVFMFRGRNALAEGRLAEAVSQFNVLWATSAAPGRTSTPPSA